MIVKATRLAKLLKEINLDQPLTFFNIETTGLSLYEDRIIALAYIKVWPNGHALKDSLVFNPEMTIPNESIEVHGITNFAALQHGTFKECAQQLWEIFSNSLYCGFNVTDFDLPFLKREFARAGMDFDYDEQAVLDSKKIYKYMEPRTLSSAYNYYCGTKEVKSTTEESKAMTDTNAAVDILSSQIEKYGYEFVKAFQGQDLVQPLDVNRKFYWRNGQPYFAFSRFVNKSVEEVAQTNPEFLEWMISADFSSMIKKVIKAALKKSKLK